MYHPLVFYPHIKHVSEPTANQCYPSWHKRTFLSTPISMSMVCRCIAFVAVQFGTLITRLRNPESVPEEWDESHKKVSRLYDLRVGTWTKEFSNARFSLLVRDSGRWASCRNDIYCRLFCCKRRTDRRRRKLLPEINVTDIPAHWHGYLQSVLRDSYCVTLNTS